MVWIPFIYETSDRNYDNIHCTCNICDLIFFSTEAINIAINPNVHGVEMQNRPSFTIHVNAN